MPTHNVIKLSLSDVSIHGMLIFCLCFVLPAKAQLLPGEPMQQYSAAFYTTADTASIEELIRTGIRYQETSQADSSLLYFEKAAYLGQRAGYTYGSVKALNNMATEHFRKRAFEQSATLFLQCLQYPIPADSASLKAKLRYNAALSYRYMGLYDRSISLLHSALAQLGRNNAEKEMLCRIYSELGLAFQYKGKYQEAAGYYFKLLSLVRQPDKLYYTYTIDACNRLAAIQLKLNLTGQAFRYFNKAALIAGHYKDTLMLAKIMVNRGVAYEELKDTLTAENLYRQAYALSRRKGYREIQHTAARNLANALARRNEPGMALGYAEEADSISATTSDFDGQINSRYTLGYIYSQLGQYRKAERYLAQAQSMMYQMGLIGNTANAHEALAYVYAAQGRYREAFEEEQAFARMNDSLRGTLNAAAVNDLEIKYKVAQKDKGLLEQRLLITQQKGRLRDNQLLLAIISIAALLLLSILTGVYRRNRHKQKLQASLLHNMQQQQELNELKARVQGEEQERKRMARELHDGISSQLYALRIHVLSLKNKPGGQLSARDIQEVLQQIEEAGSELRATAHNLSPDLVLRDGLPMALATFCAKTEKYTGLKVPFHTYGAVPQLEPIVALSVYRMIQELVQNALKHARASRIMVQLGCQNGLLNVTVEDNGIGLDTGGTSYRPESGLAGIATRMPALHGQMDIKSIPGKGTAIYLEIDIRELSHTEPLF